MNKTKPKHRPGIHLYCEIMSKPKGGIKYHYKGWYWHIVSKNGRIIARSSETYTRKGNAVKSIKVAYDILFGGNYYDHSKPDSPLQSYL